MSGAPVHPGDVIAGRYRIDRVLGAGGMGVVVAATDLVERHEQRAIKLMSRTALGDAGTVKRFMREARAAARLRGEHTTHLYEGGHLENGAPFIVMELLEGRDLRAELEERGKLPFGEALTIVLQACEALAEAHAAGVVHRDLKPANLFLVKRPPDPTATGAPAAGPMVKVLDFGIAKVAPDTSGDTTDVTATDVLMGSPHYMSPEQMQESRAVDARADVWSMGVIAYQLVTGRLPFEGDGLGQVAASVLEGNPAPPSTLAPGLPPALDAAILACLERDRERRCKSIVELAASLAPFAPSAAAPSLARLLGVPTPSKPIARARRRGRTLWIAVAAAAILLGAALAFLLLGVRWGG